MPLVSLLVVVGVLVSSEAALACDCARSGFACAAKDTADVVFVGRVIAGGTTEPWPSVDVPVQMSVREVFKGRVASNADVSGGVGDCARQLTHGRDYLVYANRDDRGRLVTSICARTAEVREAAGDLAELRRLQREPNGKGLVGDVQKLRRVPENSVNTEHDSPLTAAAVTITKGRQVWRTRTDGLGVFSVWQLTPGDYTLSVEAPAGFVGGESQVVSIGKTASCAVRGVLVLPAYRP